MSQKKIEICIECKDREARHWRSLLCEECFTEILNTKFEEDKAKEKNK